MSDRERIFSSIRSALQPLGDPTPYPDWEDGWVVCRAHPTFPTLWELFAHKLTQVSGTPIEGKEAMVAFLAERGHALGYCDAELIPYLEAATGAHGIRLEPEFDRGRIDDYTFGITWASGAIAETGTIVLTDRETPSRLGALAPWTHLAVLRPETLWADMPAALPMLDNDPSIIFVTGPSKTADVEGILIQGVHGPGIQACCLWDG